MKDYGKGWNDGPLYQALSPVCGSCKHLRSVVGRTCTAFLGGIPDEIWSGQNDHTGPVEGDGGVRFEQFE